MKGKNDPEDKLETGICILITVLCIVYCIGEAITNYTQLNFGLGFLSAVIVLYTFLADRILGLQVFVFTAWAFTLLKHQQDLPLYMILSFGASGLCYYTVNSETAFSVLIFYLAAYYIVINQDDIYHQIVHGHTH